MTCLEVSESNTLKRENTYFFHDLVQINTVVCFDRDFKVLTVQINRMHTESVCSKQEELKRNHLALLQCIEQRLRQSEFPWTKPHPSGF